MGFEYKYLNMMHVATLCFRLILIYNYFMLILVNYLAQPKPNPPQPPLTDWSCAVQFL